MYSLTVDWKWFDKNKINVDRIINDSYNVS